MPSNRTNKKEAQIAKKKRHKQNMRRGKGMPKKRPYGRKREVKPSIYILTNGQNTEVQYLEHFQVTSATIEFMNGEPDYLLEKTIEKKKKKEFDQYWLVFDKDEVSDETFNAAIQKAEKNDIQCAYSNQGFELWFLLHFNYIYCEIDRNTYDDKVNEQLKGTGLSYDGKNSKELSEEMWNKLFDKIDTAIINAEKGHKHHKGLGNTAAQAESSTTVYKLAELMKKHMRP
jgi:hypothetical protein